MTVRKLIDFVELLPPNRRVVGLDIGEKTVGVALSDLSRTVATPMETLTVRKFSKTATQILDICVEHEVAALIIGLPINMDGTEGPRCQSVRQFARNLEAHFDMEMAFWDERLSTVAVTKTMLEADLSREKRSKNVDKLAASYILQGALDFIQNHANEAQSQLDDSWG